MSNLLTIGLRQIETADNVAEARSIAKLLLVHLETIDRVTFRVSINQTTTEKINLIKAIRDEWKECGLKQAKDLVEGTNSETVNSELFGRLNQVLTRFQAKVERIA